MQVQLNGEAIDVDSNATVGQVLERLEVKPSYVAVEVNLEVVPREQHATFALQEGDAIEVVTLVGGG